MPDPQVRGCHLVGSVCLPDAESVFRQCSAGMPNRLRRIPDGETGKRNWFTFFQANLFSNVPEMVTEFVNNAAIESEAHTPEQVSEGIEKLRKSVMQTGYDDVAIESYQTFRKLRDEGAIPRGTRLQVSLPTPPNVITPFVQKDFHAATEPIYQEALYRAMKRIQAEIPHEDLAIQIDLAVDTAFWEGAELYKPWFDFDGENFEARKEYIADYIVRMLSQVEQDVEVGIHNCYDSNDGTTGDMEHRHWLEPTSLRVVSERGLRVLNKSPHKVNFFHLPVPRSAMDFLDDFFEPLKELLPTLREHGTELYLGVVQYDDLEGTQKRIAAAKKALGDFPFGVATECGWGRTPDEEMESIMKISSEVSEPIM